MFSNPLEVADLKGRIQILDWDESEYPILLNNDGVPEVLIKLTNGNGAKIRFDKKQLYLSGFDFNPNRCK